MSATDRSRQPIDEKRACGSADGSYQPIARLFADYRQAAHGPQTLRTLRRDLHARVAVAVDAGCGPGLLTAELARHADRVVALDASPAMARIAARTLSQRGVHNVTVLAGDVCEPPLPAASCDLVLAAYLVHLTDPTRSLPALAALLRPGGTLLVEDSLARPDLPVGGALGRSWWLVVWAASTLLRAGPRAFLRLVRLLCSAPWRCLHRRFSIAARELRDACSTFLPGASIEVHRYHAVVVWRAPGDDGRNEA